LFTQVESWPEDDPTHFTIVQTYPDGSVNTIYAALEITCGDTSVDYKTNECTDNTFNACVHTSTASSPIADLAKTLGREAGCYTLTTSTDASGVTTTLSGSVTGSPALDDPCAADGATATSSLSLMTAAAAAIALALLYYHIYIYLLL